MGKLIWVIVIVGAFALGVFVGRMPVSLPFFDDTSATNTSPKTTATPDETAGEEKGTVISTTNLSAGQQQLLSKLGIDASKITVTPAMIACAEAKLGATRMNEIAGGATPSFAEGVSLLACYK